jgi:DNA invertase Pin-like site-specific DNA recombinase
MGLYGFIGDIADREDHFRQHFGILSFVSNRSMGHIHIIEESVPGLAGMPERRLGDLVVALSVGDALVISELTRIGRTTFEVMDLLIFLVKKGVEIHVVSDRHDLGGIERPGQSLVLCLIAELKKEMAGGSTKASANRKEGKVLGRPVGSLGVSKLDGKEMEIRCLLEKGETKASIARTFNISRPTLHDFVVSRKLAE